MALSAYSPATADKAQILMNISSNVSELQVSDVLPIAHSILSSTFRSNLNFCVKNQVIEISDLLTFMLQMYGNYFVQKNVLIWYSAVAGYVLY